MYRFLVALVLQLLSFVSGAFAQQINTPNQVVACSNVQISWTGGTAPFTILVLPGGASNSSPVALEMFPGIISSPYAWNVIEPAGTSLFLRLIDAAGASTTTGVFTVIEGGSCGGSISPSSTIVGTPSAESTPSTLGNPPTIRPPQNETNTRVTSNTSGGALPTGSNGVSNPSPESKVGTIVAGVVSGVILVVIACVVLIFFCVRRRRETEERPIPSSDQAAEKGAPSASTGPWTDRPVWTIPPLSPTFPDTSPTTVNSWTTPTTGPPTTFYSSPDPRASTASPVPSEMPPTYSMPLNKSRVASQSSPPLPSMYTANTEEGGSSNISEQTYRDIVGQFAAANRESISLDLEAKLRTARYVPTDDPSEISVDDWKNDYGVTYFELKRLQEIYDRNNPSMGKEKAVFSAGQGGRSWRPPR